MTHGGDSILIDSSIGCDPGVTSLSSSFNTRSGLEDAECNIEKTIFNEVSKGGGKKRTQNKEKDQ